MRKFPVIVLLSFSLFFVATAQAGSFTGNGADRKGLGHGAAWFAGQSTFRWCTTDSRLAAPFERAISLWNNYLAEKNIHAELKSPVNISARGEKLSACNGTEQLRLELDGDQDEKFLSTSELQILADANGTGSVGQILIRAQALSNTEVLNAQLLHQLGHVLGNDHSGGTVMAEETVLGNGPMPKFIDGARELYLCRSCTTSLIGAGAAIYREAHGVATLSNRPITFTAEIANPALDNGNLFLVAHAGKEYSLASRGLSRLAILDNRPVIVHRNFGVRVQVQSRENGLVVFEGKAE